MAERSRKKKYCPWKIGDKVWLSAANLLTTLPSRKLALKQYGPFPITAVLSPITFSLKLLKQWKVHPTFHASELSSYRETDIHGPNYTEPPPDVINGEEEYKVEAILSHRGTGKRRRYLVSWIGYSSGSNEWIPEENLWSSKELLTTYKRRHKLN